MQKQLNQLSQFQRAFNSTYNTSPSLLLEEDYILRFKLLQEENEEYFEAAMNNDIVEVADALGDIIKEFPLCGVLTMVKTNRV